MTGIPAPITSYRRAEQNRRNSRWLIVLFVLLLIPPLMFLAQLVGVTAAAYLTAAPGSPAWIQSVVVTGHLIMLVLLIAFVANVFRARRVLPQSLHAVPVAGEEGKAIVHRLENLSLAAGMETPALLLMRSRQPNALATGWPGKRPTVVLTDGLLRTVDKRGLDGILAHELVHLVNEDTRIDSTLAAMIRTTRLPLPVYLLFVSMILTPFAAVGTAEFVTWLESNWHAALAGGYNAQGELYGWMPQWLFVLLFVLSSIGYFTILLWPPLAKYLQSRVSRQREFLADAEAATLTRDPLGLARALQSVAAWPTLRETAPDKPATVPGGSGGKDISRARGISHLCIVPNRRSFLASWFSTHPAPAERIAALRRMAPPEGEARPVPGPDAELAAAAEAILLEPAAPRSREQHGRIDPIPAGLAAGVIAETLLFVAFRGTAHGIGGGVAAYVANRRAGRREWWPVIAMIFLGGPLTSGLLPPFGSLVLQPLAGAALGAKSREALSAVRKWITAKRPGG